jgi:polyphenol oxidase
MSNLLESAEAIGAVDAIFAGAGLEHGRRATRVGSWRDGERVKEPKRKLAASSRAGKAAGVVRVEAWGSLPWLRAGFSTREGGGSTVYGHGELNLGWTKDDDPEVVAANRKRFLKATMDGAKFSQVVTMRQFHSGRIAVLEDEAGPLLGADGKAKVRADGLLTGVAGRMLGVSTADCVPVLIVDKKRRVVGAFHAGWRGTLARIVERGVGTMRLRYGSKAGDLTAAIGPAIGACCYSVGEDVRFDFGSQFAYAPELFTEVYDSDPVKEKYPLLFLTARAPGHSNIGPQIHVDLQEANRRQLLDAGLKPGAIHVVGECTACTRLKAGRLKYFSHRGEHGFTGRMMSVVGVVG